MRVLSRDDLVDTQVGQFGSTQARLDGDEQKSVIAPTDPGPAIGRAQEGFELGTGEEVDEPAVEALVRDVEHSLDLTGVIGHEHG